MNPRDTKNLDREGGENELFPSTTCPTCHGVGALHGQAGAAVPIPDALFDGRAVYAELDVKAHSRTSADNVSDVLDAVVRLMRKSGVSGAAGAGEVKPWQERVGTPGFELGNAEFCGDAAKIAARDAEIADLRAQLARLQAPVGGGNG